MRRSKEFLSFGSLLLVSAVVLSCHHASHSPGRLLYVSNTDPTCGGQPLCFPTIRAALDRVRSRDTIRILSGTYHEQVFIDGLNGSGGAGEASRITIEADPLAVDQVIVAGTPQPGRCDDHYAIRVSASRFVTLRGLIVTDAQGPAIVLDGGPMHSASIHIERNRIFGNGSPDCSGGILVETGNSETLIANNLIHSNSGNGISFATEPTRTAGAEGHGEAEGRGQDSFRSAPHVVVQNTIHSNGAIGVDVAPNEQITLVNNAITFNGEGVSRELEEPLGFDLHPENAAGLQPEDVLLLNNLICGNAWGEIRGPLLDRDDRGNWTPSGSEGSGVEASPECAMQEAIYENVEGLDGIAGTIDDDFDPTGPGVANLPSPAIDRGVDPRELGLSPVFDRAFEADYLAEDVRPRQRDLNRPLDFDIGALELACDCSSCGTCRIDVHGNSSSDICELNFDPLRECCDRKTGERGDRFPGGGNAMEECPDARFRNPEFDPKGDSDGCSVPADLVDILPGRDKENPTGCEDSEFGSGRASRPRACEKHDFCYSTCGEEKAECDDAFRREMLDVCVGLRSPDDANVVEQLICSLGCPCLAECAGDLVACLTCFRDNDCQDRLMGSCDFLCRPICEGIAVEYYEFVRDSSDTAYTDSQNRSCQCCTNCGSYDPSVECCERATGAIGERQAGQAYDLCRDERVSNPEFVSTLGTDGCFAPYPGLTQLENAPNIIPLCGIVVFGSGNDAFPEPCDHHDYCYQTCGSSKAECDEVLRQDLASRCGQAFGPLCEPLCRQTADAYVQAFIDSGQPAYAGGQNRACQCCTDALCQ